MQTERRIEKETQKTIETVGYIHLYNDRIETPSNVFVLGDVFDVTSRSLSAATVSCISTPSSVYGRSLSNLHPIASSFTTVH